MDTYTMNILKSLLRVLPGKAAVRAVLALLFVAASLPLFAQTAEVRYAGVFYKNGYSTDTIKNVYCDWSQETGDPYSFKIDKSTTNTNNRSFTETPPPTNNGNKNDPWASSALIEYDQPYPNV